MSSPQRVPADSTPPVGPAEEQTLTTVERIGARTTEALQFPCRFVKLIGREGWPDEKTRGNCL